MFSSTLRPLTRLVSRPSLSRPLVQSVSIRCHLVVRPLVASEPRRQFGTAEIRHDIDDESDIIELGKEEMEEIFRDPDDVVFEAKIKAARREKNHDINDESDIIELGKQEQQDLQKEQNGITMSPAKKKRFHIDKVELDIEDESDVIEYAKATKGEPTSSSHESLTETDEIPFDIEDESDFIELEKEEKEEMIKKKL